MFSNDNCSIFIYSSIIWNIDVLPSTAAEAAVDLEYREYNIYL